MILHQIELSFLIEVFFLLYLANILITTGFSYGQDSVYDSEIIDLLDPTNTCPNGISDYPLNIYGATGDLIMDFFSHNLWRWKSRQWNHFHFWSLLHLWFKWICMDLLFGDRESWCSKCGNWYQPLVDLLQRFMRYTLSRRFYLQFNTVSKASLF